MWLRPWTNGPIPGCKCGHTFTGQHNRTICHRVQVYTCSSTPEPTSTFSLLVPPARPFTGFKSHTAFSLYICPNPFDILFYPIIYINITICLSIFSFNLSRNKAQFFSLMVSFGVIGALRRNIHWHTLPIKYVELIQKLDLRRWLSVGLALFYQSFMICIYKCLPVCVFVTKNITFSRRSIGHHVSHKKWALSQ